MEPGMRENHINIEFHKITDVIRKCHFGSYVSNDRKPIFFGYVDVDVLG